MAALALDAATERVAVNLLRHLEWQADGFSLVFLFADVGPSLQLADWLDQRLLLQERPLQRQEAKDQFARDPEAAVDALVASLAALSAQPGACWFAAQRHPSDKQWNAARSRFLARLNERRFLLERDLRRPLVLVMPADFRAEARSIAPDIWHVRTLSEELRAAPAPVPATQAPRASDTPTAAPAAVGPLLAYDEWLRMLTSTNADGVFLPTAWRACEELLANGRPADAEQVALSALSLARQRAANSTPTALRDLSISLNNVGQVARAQGDWSQAEAVYRESLALCRQLADRLGGTPGALRDLSVSLNNVGDVARAQGDWSRAEAVYREGLALSRQLAERLGGTPEALRDLAVSLDNMGQVARAQGDWAQADPVYREGLALSRQLVERLGDTPEALRDLSISLNNVGQVAWAQGDWVQAEAVYSEGLALSRRLVERLGGTPRALRDLSVSLIYIGQVARAQGDWSKAGAVYQESLALRRQLVERLGGTPEALRDLSVSLIYVGGVARAQGDWALAEAVYREGLALSRQLVERLGGTPEALRDLSVSLNNVGGVARAQGDWAQAEGV